MEVKIDGNPGTGNTFQEIKIGYVENYVPNATTVINNHYGESGKAKPQTDKETSKADLLVRRGEIMQYVGNLRPYVSEKWKNRYEATWHAILDLPAVAAVIYEPGKQKDRVSRLCAELRTDGMVFVPFERFRQLGGVGFVDDTTVTHYIYNVSDEIAVERGVLLLARLIDHRGDRR